METQEGPAGNTWSGTDPSAGPPPAPLPRSFFQRDARVVARALLGKVLVRDDGRSARIVETEAYRGSLDPGSHTYRGPTPRNATMFGPAGHLYVYFTYGMHWCANAVCGDESDGTAVLLRAAAPLTGLEAMRDARRVRRDVDLCNGPAKLCQAFGVDRAFDGADVVAADRGLWFADDGTAPPRRPGNSTRVGLTQGRDHPWRWWVPGDPNVSKGRPS
ncbi:MAG: DNA-3-methyladenine glycosylase [Acidimicrobiia bacterium]|nr:DNA-3-methyladenine glycosylase [Acidimicrobiia bacterium]